MKSFIRKYKKILTVINVIVLYMAFLSLISAVKSAPDTKIVEAHAVSGYDFTTQSDPQFAGLEEGILHILPNDADTVFSAPVSLENGSAFQVKFIANCVSEGILHVDLMAPGYDSEENEFTYVLTEGENLVSGMLPFGAEHPNSCSLRIFTLDSIDATLSEIDVSRYAPFSGVTRAEVGSGIVILLCVLLQVFFLWMGRVDISNLKVLEEKKLAPEHVEQDMGYMRVNKEYKYLPEIVSAGIIFCTIFLVVYCFLGFNKAGIGAPWSYHGGDDFTHYTFVKTAVEGGWIWANGKLGAPYGSCYFDQANMLLMNTEFLVAKVLGIFIKDIVTLVNVQYLLTFCLCGISSFFVLRELNIRRIYAILGGIFFGLSPYIFERAIAHYCLGACYFVPFSILLCIWAGEDDRDYLKIGKGFFKNRKNVATIILAVLIANNGIGYYPFFTCFFLCVVALLNIIYTKKFSSIRKPLLIIGFITISLVLAIVPLLIYQIIHGSNLTAMQRGVEEAEIFGLKIVQLFVPTNGHGIKFLDNLIAQYNTRAPLVNENRSAYLGLSGILGFLLLLLYLFVPEREGDSINQKRLRLLSRLAVCAVLFATIGGFSSLLALFFRALRGYNRISIFIRFICICALCTILQQCFDHKFKKNDRLKNGLLSIFLGGLAVVCLLDQLPPYGAQDNLLAANTNIYKSDSKFVKDIESQLQADDMVFQLPYHAYPESGRVNAMGDYQHLTGYIHSKSLKWSYGGMKGRAGDIWYKYVASLPVDELIDVILSYGFRGIYIDTRAYTQDNLTVLLAQIEEAIRSSPTVSENGTLLFYNLYPYLTEHPELTDSQLAEETSSLIDIGIYRYSIGETVYFDGTAADAHKYFVSGISGTEIDFAWTDGNAAELCAFISEEVTDNLELTINLKHVFLPHPQKVVIVSNDLVLFDQMIESTAPIIVSIPKECITDQCIRLQMQFPNAVSTAEISDSADTRKLAIGIASFVIQ